MLVTVKSQVFSDPRGSIFSIAHVELYFEDHKVTIRATKVPYIQSGTYM